MLQALKSKMDSNSLMLIALFVVACLQMLWSMQIYMSRSTGWEVTKVGSTVYSVSKKEFYKWHLRDHLIAYLPKLLHVIKYKSERC